MDHIKEELANADPFKTWWPFIISVMAAVAITIRSLSPTIYCNQHQA